MKKTRRNRREPNQGNVRAAENVAGTSQTEAPSVGGGLSPGVGFGGLLVILTATFWAYWPTLLEVFEAWRVQPDYSHGYFVAPLAVLFLWLGRATFPREAVGPSPIGLVLLGIAGAGRIVAGMYYLQPLDSWTIPLWLMGCVWTLFGWRVLRWALPSLIFLWFLFPLPYTAESLLKVPLQSIATSASTAILVTLGQAAINEGNTMWVGDNQLFVEEACSGIRIFVGIFALAFAFVLFSSWPWWQKALTLLAALPIAVIANATRIVVTGLLYQWTTDEAARGFLHDFSGFVMIPFAAALFFMFLVYIDRLFPEVELIRPTAAYGMQQPE